MPVVGIILGFLVVLVAAAGGVLVWNRMRSGLPGAQEGEEGGDRDQRERQEGEMGQRPERGPHGVGGRCDFGYRF